MCLEFFSFLFCVTWQQEIQNANFMLRSNMVIPRDLFASYSDCSDFESGWKSSIASCICGDNSWS
ncbi:hypothetical protein IHE45_02G040000 [Dioscorea alata]|uniref:Uncharacterized protein n=1 Tax=Dioscorea alata TaxID=55571 RepID=A0ACB7WP84_DIOAL|nr:hypothetical protein IHE45_02G040000 [Dioscorea alata]